MSETPPQTQQSATSITESIGREDISTRRWLRFFLPTAAFILITDLWSKAAVFAHASVDLYPRPLPGVEFPSWILPAWNTGVAWSMFDSVPMLIAIMTAFLLPILFFVYMKYYCNKHALVDLAFGSVLGGACANAYDRFMAQFSDSFFGVRDFIHVRIPIVNYDWPIFNIADAGISCGFVVLLIASFLQKETPATTQGDSQASKGTENGNET